MCGVMPDVSSDRYFGRVQPWRIAIRDAALVVLGSAVIGLGVNALRSDGIALVQHDPYEILVPCPETAGDAPAMEVAELVPHDPRVLILDARPAERFHKGHLPNAMNVPFDYLEPTAPETIRKIAAMRVREAVVYGDGNDPDSGEQLGRELAGKGIRNVRFVRGGARALGLDSDAEAGQ